MSRKALDSNRHFYSAWGSWALSLPRGRALREDGLALAWMDKLWAVGNQVFLDSALNHPDDLDRYVSLAKKLAAPLQKPWMLTLCTDLVPADISIESILENHGFSLATVLTGMETERLNPAPETLPQPEFRPVASQADGVIYGQINADAYGIPEELGVEALQDPELWTFGNTHGVIAFDGGTPAACASTVRINRDDAYLAIVATRQNFRKRGLAEAAMRKSMEMAFPASGFKKAILHASPEGKSLYEKMGFQTVTHFKAFVLQEFLG